MGEGRHNQLYWQKGTLSYKNCSGSVVRPRVPPAERFVAQSAAMPGTWQREGDQASSVYIVTDIYMTRFKGTNVEAHQGCL